jgi:predicted DNA-binding helix-hairpin-helix protein
MESITDSEYGKVQYNINSGLGKPNVYSITLIHTSTLTLTTNLLGCMKQHDCQYCINSSLTWQTKHI